MTSLNTEYDKRKSWGISVSVDLHDCNSDFIKSEAKIREFVVKLCELIEVKPVGDCAVVHFESKTETSGYAMTQLIEASLISGYFVTATNTVFLDIFASQYFDPEMVASFAEKFFEATDAVLHYTLRK